MRATQSDGLQAIYTIRELAEMAGVSKKRISRLLDSCGVEYLRAGRDRLVTISELEQKCESIWSAAKLAHNLRLIERERYEQIKQMSDESECHVGS